MINIEALKSQGCELWWPGQTAISGTYSETGTKCGFLILPDGVTVTPTGTFTSIKGKDGRSYYKFDGSTSYITISDHAAWSMFEADFTICGWVKFDTVAANKAIIGQYVDASNYWSLTWTTGNTVALIGVSGGTTSFSYSCPLTAVANTWYFISIVKSGTTCLMYIDQAGQTVTATQAWRNITDIAAIIGIGKVSTIYQEGNIKDLMIFKKALTQDQIGALMAETYIY